MARESTITYEQVVMAAEAIRASGVKPTSRSIREKLGKGSMGTVLRFLQRWLDEQEQERAPENTIDPSIVRTISSHVNSRLEEMSKKSSARLEDLQAEADSLISENERQMEELEAQRVELLDWQQKCAELAGQAKQLETANANLSSELKGERKAAESARVELAKTELRLESALTTSSEIATVKAELQKATNQVAEFREKAAVYAAKLEAETNHRKSLEQQILELRPHENSVRK